ncbi:Uncharacterised protein [Shigella sonnei]|nr:Uncharacterised protein [Shigella sonnei]
MRFASSQFRFVYQQRQFACLSIHTNDVPVAHFCQQPAIVGFWCYVDS